MTRRIREVGKAVAEVARGLAETEQEQERRYQYAIRKDTLKPARNGLLADGL